MTHTFEFKLSASDFLSIAKQAYSDGDALKSVVYLRKAIAADPECDEAYLTLSQTYRDCGAFELANQVLYKRLAQKEDDEGKFFGQLGVNFLEADNLYVADYYLGDIITDEDVDDFGPQRNLRLASGDDKDYYESLIERAFDCLNERRFKDALELLEKVSETSGLRYAADHAKLICLMLDKNPDAVIDNAKEMLKARPDNLAVRSTMISAMIYEERMEEAYVELEKLSEHDYTRPEQILLVLPLYAQMNSHVQVVKYAKRILQRAEFQPNIMLWLAQGLYNIGQKDEARKTLVKLNNFFGGYAPAEYYLERMRRAPENLEYCPDLPYEEILRRHSLLSAMLIDGQRDMSGDPEFEKIIDWAIEAGDAQFKGSIISALARRNWICSEQKIRDILISPDLTVENLAKAVSYLLAVNPRRLNVDVVAMDRFKRVRFDVPDKLDFDSESPANLLAVGHMCIADIIFTDEDPNMYLAELGDVLSSLSPSAMRAISRMRSAHTLMGVIINKVYDGEETEEETLERYGITKRMFDKYYKILFGDEDGEE